MKVHMPCTYEYRVLWVFYVHESKYMNNPSICTHQLLTRCLMMYIYISYLSFQEIFISRPRARVNEVYLHVGGRGGPTTATATNEGLLPSYVHPN